tara:strand:+ start:822 stop:1271 length:450 start_codon:yes stop_codon:yes gene_type:complete
MDAIFILFGILIITIIIIIICNNDKNIYKPFDIKPSVLLNNGERGLYASRNYKEGDIIERCPTIPVDIDSNVNILNDYYYDSTNSDKFLLSLGYCSLINHSKEKQNCTWEITKDDNFVVMQAIRDIVEGEELYIHYGDEYWKERNHDEK